MESLFKKGLLSHVYHEHGKRRVRRRRFIAVHRPTYFRNVFFVRPRVVPSRTNRGGARRNNHVTESSKDSFPSRVLNHYSNRTTVPRSLSDPPPFRETPLARRNVGLKVFFSFEMTYESRFIHREAPARDGACVRVPLVSV